MTGIDPFMFFYLPLFLTYLMSIMNKESPNSLLERIHTYNEEFIWINNPQNWHISQQKIQVLKTPFTIYRPFKLHTLLLQGGNWVHNFLEHFNKTSIIT
jgi:hypothetical protein